MPALKRILVVRNDKLGDFMLALPVFHLLKRALPNTAIHALVPAYTKSLADACEAIDAVQTDPGANASQLQQLRLLRSVRSAHYDAMVTLFSTTRIGLLGLLAGIRYRLAPATKLAQVFYNSRLVQRRSRSAQPEYAYNLDIGERCLRDLGVAIPERPPPPYLKFADDVVTGLRHAFCEANGIPHSHRLVFAHPGSGGSASNLAPAQFATLAQALRSDRGHTVVVSAGPDEIDHARQVADRLD
ncbi:MAG: glycosyltransferase family 9 protein, partial [Pseudomonadota bacterium]